MCQLMTRCERNGYRALPKLNYGGAQRQRSLLGVFGSEFQLVSA